MSVEKELSHVDSHGKPTMVDVSAKAVSLRTAVAESRVKFPESCLPDLVDGEIHTKKGPVFHTAIIAGTMAAKKTHELIPFCHPLALEKCSLDISIEGQDVVISCSVSLHHKTGVEMEALTGASVAALTIYDMCKAMTHEMEITDTRLISKSGGKSDYQYENYST